MVFGKVIVVDVFFVFDDLLIFNFLYYWVAILYLYPLVLIWLHIYIFISQIHLMRSSKSRFIVGDLNFSHSLKVFFAGNSGSKLGLGLVDADELLVGGRSDVIDFERFDGLFILPYDDGFVGIVGFDGMGKLIFPQ